jgi:hypothetical protein
MRAQKMREEAAEKERDEHLNTIWPVIPMRQEWRVKEKAGVHPPTASDDDMDRHGHQHGVHIANRV